MDEPRYYLWFGVWVLVSQWRNLSGQPPPPMARLMFGPRFTGNTCPVCNGAPDHVVGCPELDRYA